MLKERALNKYALNPKFCANCNTILLYEKKSNKFCSSSCAGTYNNARKDWANIKTGPAKKPPKQTVINPYPFSKLKQCTCKHCGMQWKNRSVVMYCNDHKELYSHAGRAKYWFTFNVYHYPDLFDLNMLACIGFRNTASNPNGITRDHRVSVNEAIKNNYDPYYIKHPINCELMLFSDNNIKHTDSSITYDDLILQVLAYEHSKST